MYELCRVAMSRPDTLRWKIFIILKDIVIIVEKLCYNIKIYKEYLNKYIELLNHNKSYL